MRKRMIIPMCALSLLLIGVAAADDQNRVRASLTGPAISGEKPSGTARSVTRDGQSRFTVQVDDVNLPDGTMLTVVLVHEGNRMRMGEMQLSQGSAELERRLQDGGQQDGGQQPQAGDTLLVVEGGMHRLAGVFF